MSDRTTGTKRTNAASLAARLESVEQKVGRLRTFQEEQSILHTLYQYGHSIDYGLDEEWLDCFAEDGVFDLRSRGGLLLPDMKHPLGKYQGRDALTQFIARSAKPPAKYRKHLLIEPRIAIRGNKATAVSYYASLHEEKGTPFLRAFGRYIDRLVKCPDGKWRIQERVDELEAWMAR
ncbi:MAG: nuclear transport factor 2 family protein [Chloroflexi bacterium]|nr:nuclear transport factor 2 family protein [Chloroflexota bacterium]